MERATSNKITYLSYLMALSVVMIHTYNVEVYGLTGAFAGFEQFVASFARFAVPTFFAISGYLFFRGYDPKDTLKKWYRRIFTLLIPYLIWNVIGYFYKTIPFYIPSLAAHINHTFPFSLKEFLKTLIMGCDVNWYLYCLILFVIFSPFLYFFLKNRYVGVLILMVGFLLGTFYRNYFLYGTFYFYGAYWAMQGQPIVEKRYRLPLRIVASCSLVVIAVVFTIFSSLPFPVYALLLLLGIVFTWIAGDFFAISGRVPACLTISFFLYVSHQYLLEILEKIFYLLLGKTFYGAVIDYFFAPILTVAILTALAMLLRRWKLIWLALAGGRG